MKEIIFEWDADKDQQNFKDHGIHFDAAMLAFRDYYRIERHDDDSSDNEDRWQTMGFVDDLLFVVYTERGNVNRIISARLAEPFERRIYHGNSETRGWERVNP
jgi:uncharacterized DUF497 family protein